MIFLIRPDNFGMFNFKNITMTNKLKLLIGLIIFSNNIFAQFIISGRVLDQDTKTPIQSVNIQFDNQSKGSITSENGEFQIESKSSKANIIFTSIGYKAKNISLNSKNDFINLGTILLQAQPYSLDEITINAGLKNEEELPVSISSLSAKSIESKVGDQPLPMVMSSIPGIFSIRDGGGSGDSKLSIRGFQQESVSLLLNGIPINGEENGLVYWSNWLGLSSAAAEIQIQKGPGLANASVNSIGGSINIITRNTKKEKSGSVNFNISSYGNINTGIALNSGELNNGWNTSLMFSFGNGPGYVDATYVKSWSYFFTANKKINEKHNITITLMGAPQSHGQRTLKLSNEDVKLNGLKFNKDWGSFNGEKKNASQNFYHKPFFSVNHDFKINGKNKLSSSAYFSYGTGGGRWSESFNYAPSIFSYRDYAEQIDWESIYENNATHNDTYTLANGENVEGYSINVQTNFLASHIQTGLMTNFEHKFSDKLVFLSGLHYRYFNSYVREEIDDLMGGNFFIEDYAWSLAGVAGRNQIKTVGDIIHVDNSTIINFANAYAQLVYNTNKINTFVSANVNNNWYQRDDRFNYIENTKSEVVSKSGFDVRAGFLFKANENNNLFVNAAYISRAPYFKYVFGNFTNVVVRDLENENVQTIEIGYNSNWKFINTKLSAYLTNRNNVSMLSNEYVQLEDNSSSRAMINGLNSSHKGIELELMFNVNRNLQLGGWMSVGEFMWQNNVSAKLFNDNNVVVDTVNVFAKGLFIGGTAQQQYSLFADFSIFKTFFVKTEYLHFANLFSDFDPTNRNNQNDFSQSFQLPSYGIVNIYLGIPFSIGNHYANFQLNAYNIFDKSYIVNGEDGAEHNLETFKGFWSMGRNLSFGFKFNF